MSEHTSNRNNNNDSGLIQSVRGNLNTGDEGTAVVDPQKNTQNTGNEPTLSTQQMTEQIRLLKEQNGQLEKKLLSMQEKIDKQQNEPQGPRGRRGNTRGPRRVWRGSRGPRGTQSRGSGIQRGRFNFRPYYRRGRGRGGNVINFYN